MVHIAEYCVQHCANKLPTSDDLPLSYNVTQILCILCEVCVDVAHSNTTMSMFYGVSFSLLVRHILIWRLVMLVYDLLIKHHGFFTLDVMDFWITKLPLNVKYNILVYRYFQLQFHKKTTLYKGTKLFCTAKCIPVYP